MTTVYVCLRLINACKRSTKKKEVSHLERTIVGSQIHRKRGDYSESDEEGETRGQKTGLQKALKMKLAIGKREEREETHEQGVRNNEAHERKKC